MRHFLGEYVVGPGLDKRVIEVVLLSLRYQTCCSQTALVQDSEGAGFPVAPLCRFDHHNWHLDALESLSLAM